MREKGFAEGRLCPRPGNVQDATWNPEHPLPDIQPLPAMAGRPLLVLARTLGAAIPASACSRRDHRIGDALG
jgi:hypothetical protein